MKYVFLVLFCCFSFVAAYAGNPDLIVGKWHMEKLEVSKDNFQTLGNKFLDFQKGGMVISSKKDSDNMLKGKWTYNANTKQIIIDNKGKQEIGQVISVSETQMQILMNEGTFYFSRVQ